MNQRYFKLFFVILALALASLACEFAFSSASAENVRLAQDQAGQQATTQFQPGDTFYLVGDLSNAPDDTKLKAVWTAVAVEGAEPNLVIEERELTAPSGPFWFSLSQQSGIWPAGSYKVELFLNDESNQTLDFQVVAPQEPQVLPTAPPPTEPAPPAGQAGISEAYTALDEQGQQPSTAFAQADKIYTVFTLQAGPEGASVKAAFIATAAEGVNPGTVISELEQVFTAGQNLIWFENSRPWPKGKYRVDLAVNGQPAQSLEVEVVSTNTSGAVISNAYSATDEQGQQATVIFPQNSEIYIHFTLENAPADTAVRGVLVAVDIPGEEPYTYVTEAGSNMGSGTYWFQYTNNGPWPVGSYVVFIYLNGELAGQVDLQVQ
jgi:hypothetical protein